MTGYTKLFASMLGSTIWDEDLATKVVWITLLLLKDRDGIAEASVPGLAHLARVSLPETEAALQKFMAPDVYSRSRDREGRRIEAVDGGWRILNHAKYRDKLSKEDIRERDRIRQQEHRDRKKCHIENVTERDNSDVSQKSHIQRQIQIQRQSRAKTHPPTPQRGERATRIPPDFHVTDEHRQWAMEKHGVCADDYLEEFVDYWTARPGKGAIKLDWDATFRNSIRRKIEGNGGGNGRSESNAKRAERESHEAITKAAANLRRRHGIGEVNGVGAGNVIETNTH